MWFIYTLLFMGFMAFVNYSDEYLTHSSATKESKNIHERVGGVLVASVLLTIVGLLISFVLADTIIIEKNAILLSLLSSIFMLATWIGYFYLFQKYSAHQVVALFGLSALWLLAIELTFGESVAIIAIIGVLILVACSYFLDIGHFKFQIPSTLLLWMVGISLSWAITALLWREAMEINTDSFAIYYWHLLGILAFFPVLFLIRPYRYGFINRLQNERGRFLGHTAFNETCSQFAFYFSVLAFATAPLATYVSALAGLQSLFLLILFYIKPIEKRNVITRVQLYSIMGIAIGIGLLEIF